jgi:hypothetical protein
MNFLFKLEPKIKKRGGRISKKTEQQLCASHNFHLTISTPPYSSSAKKPPP